VKAVSVKQEVWLAVVEPFAPVIVVGCYSESIAQDGSSMADTYIIEVSSKAAGIVVRDTEGYRFFAATQDFDSLEGRYFRSARDAERAAIQFDLARRGEVAAQG
jgi:hypothetical protein